MFPVFINDRLNPQAFDPQLWRGTNEMTDVLLAAADTRSPRIGTTHFLMILSRIADGAAIRAVQDKGIGRADWESGLRTCVTPDRVTLPPANLTRDSLDADACAMFDDAEKRCAEWKRERINDVVLLLSGLQYASPAVRSLLQDAGIDAAAWCRELDDLLRPVHPLELFDATPGAIRVDSLSGRARKVMSVMRDEAHSLGYEMIDARHLLSALLAQNGGVTQYALHRAGVSPRRVQESVMLALRARSRAGRSEVPLDRDHLQSQLRRTLVHAGELAVKDHMPKVAEVHLLRALLASESTARGILEDEALSPQLLLDSIARWDSSEELMDSQPSSDESAVADIDTVRQRIGERLVGQDEAVQQILPYVQRMRFGFSMPGRPLGVFLFCGPSGVGKTQMAKELAHAVFGSHENLIFLEMGQFNSKESMNIFVGVPPGYIGYGEGKLTNGLRDKPRSVVLFDEVEKAYPLVLDALLRFLDEGRIDDPAGPVRDGSGCIVVLTSNVGSTALAKLWRKIESDPNWRTVVRRELRRLFRRRRFRPEFLNRVDELVFFRPLREQDYAEIGRRALADNLRRLAEQRGIHVTLDGVCEMIGAYCATVEEGARAAHRLTLSVVVTPVIEYVVRNKVSPPIHLSVKAARNSQDPDAEPFGVVTPLAR